MEHLARLIDILDRYRPTVDAFPIDTVPTETAVHTPCSNIFSLATTNSTCSRVSDSALGKLTP